MIGLARIRKNRSNRDKLLSKVWKLLSELVRRKSKGCYTCGKWYEWKLLDAGHFRHGKWKATYLDERNVRGQCVACNKWRSGNLGIYGVKLVKEIGQDEVDELIQESYATKMWKVKELEELEIYFKEKLRELGDKGLY